MKEFAGCKVCYRADAFERQASMACTRAAEVYCVPSGYVRFSRDWEEQICSESCYSAGAMRGYMVSTESLRGERAMELM